MAQNQLTLNITVASVESMLKGFDFDDDQTFIELLIELHSSSLESVVAQQGFAVEEVSATKHKRLYNVCRFIVILRVSAEIMETYAHDSAALGESRQKRATELERRIIDMPESMSDDWDAEKHSGTWEFSDTWYEAELQRVASVNWRCLNSF